MLERLKNVLYSLYSYGFKAKPVDSIELPRIDPRVPWKELDKRAGIRGEVDDTRASEFEDSGFYYNKELNVDRELRRTEK